MSLAERPRLALCGNVFPADSLAEVQAALVGPVSAWAAAVRAQGGPERPALGIYLAASAAETLVDSATERAALHTALARAGVEVWTANAFPFGGFHGARVKERAFEPDWRDPRRLRFTEQVIGLLAGIAPSGSRLSISSCPLGYGDAARKDPRARAHLLRAQAICDVWTERRGAPVLLALEPEPDGGFERAAELCAWLAELEGARPSTERRLALCWDLCHGAVVGESAESIVAALGDTGTPLGKIQISAALALSGSVDAAARTRLADFAADPYFHQVRARNAAGVECAWRDLPEFLADAERANFTQFRTHCHVPLQRDDYGDGLRSTAWRADLAVLSAAAAAGRLPTDFDAEVETYTLPVLPPDARGRGTLAELLAEETRAARKSLGLDGGSAASYSLPPEAAPGGFPGPIV